MALFTPAWFAGSIVRASSANGFFIPRLPGFSLPIACGTSAAIIITPGMLRVCTKVGLRLRGWSAFQKNQQRQPANHGNDAGNLGIRKARNPRRIDANKFHQKTRDARQDEIQTKDLP